MQNLTKTKKLKKAQSPSQTISTRHFKLIDFDDFEKNSFYCVAELEFKNGEDSFRPDITLLINGLPLAFIELKIPHNKEGILSERKRMQTRLANKKFKKFFNALQILVFSNNQEYDEENITPISGAFYATPSNEIFFNCFREENFELLASNLASLDNAVENEILQDNNLISIKSSPEFITNKDINTPTNRLLISLFSKQRLKMLLKYAISYVKGIDKDGQIHTQKHILRYQQFFALNAIKNALEKGTKKGIIWHTQGSGKTALAFYSLRFLQDYFTQKGIVARFYFIVDRIDLLEQATSEFKARGLFVHTVQSKIELEKELKSQKSAISNPQGNLEITVINIQKIPADTQISPSKYNVKIQRVFFIDEAHRSYDAKGSYFANLMSLDEDAIFISLTGTPLLGTKHKKASTALWGAYIHKYYYNASIMDGYTVKLIHEGIETRYKEQLKRALDEITIKDKDLAIKQIYAHEKFVSPMLAYIAQDLEKARMVHNDSTLGAMVVCSSSEQAKNFFKIFNEYYKNTQDKFTLNQAALILHDIDDKETRKRNVKDFKAGKIDILFVYNMLLTGFDAPRLKKLYIDREIAGHNLLQTLTRVNRPYKDYRYGYIVDFAGIQQEFDKVNQAYFNELQSELGDDFEKFNQIFKSEEQIKADLESIKLALFDYDTSNKELFSRQIDALNDKAILHELRKALILAKELRNIIHIQGDTNLLDKFEFDLYKDLLKTVSLKIDELNFKEYLANKSDITALRNLAMEDIVFKFIKISEKELKFSDSLKDALIRTQEAFRQNFDSKDAKFISLEVSFKEALMELFDKNKLKKISSEDLETKLSSIDEIYAKLSELNRQNALIAHKYKGDYKFARIHKRLLESHTAGKIQLYEALSQIKEATDKAILDNESILENEGFFEKRVISLVAQHFSELLPKLNFSIETVARLIIQEYFNEYKAKAA
nr:DEAD/DEAH box helicase family protein [Campylobacter troglodytis]